MKTTDAPSKINGISLSSIEVVIGSAGDMSLKVQARLVSKTGETYGVTERVGGWSSPVIEAVGELARTLENHLLSTSFDVGEEDDNRAAKLEHAGILNPGLASS